MTQKIGTLLNNHNIYGRTDFFWTSNQGIQLIQTHPSTEILTLVGFVNPQKKKKKIGAPTNNHLLNADLHYFSLRTTIMFPPDFNHLMSLNETKTTVIFSSFFF